MVSAYVFLNQNPLAMYRGLERGDALRFAYNMSQISVAPLESEELERLCDKVFTILNDNVPSDYEARSLSVGDVVTLVSGEDSTRRVSYVALRSGWGLLPTPVTNNGKWGDS